MNKTQVDDAHDIDLVIPMYNLIEYSDTFTKTSGSLYKFYRDEPALNNICNIIDFSNDNNNSISFKYKQQITGQTWNNGTKDVELIVPYLINIWKTLQIPFINCEITPILPFLFFV